MSNPALMLDYLFVGRLIKARLASNVVGLELQGAVLGIESLAQATERSINAPTAYVLWEGDRIDVGPQGNAGNGRWQMAVQSWTVLVAVRNADQDQHDARNESAGPLISSVHRALAGWKPMDDLRPFTRAQGRKATYTANVGLYPLTFEILLNL